MFCNIDRTFQIDINIIFVLNPCIVDQNFHRGDLRVFLSVTDIQLKVFIHRMIDRCLISIKSNYNNLLQPSGEEFHLRKLHNVPIAVLKVFPGIHFEIFEGIMTEALKGVVIETFGSGNMPERGGKLLPLIRKAADNGTILAICTQCPQGTVSLGTYEVSNNLKLAGAVSGWDLTTEAAIAKLYYLFSCGYEEAEIKRLMETDLRGEVSIY